MGQELQLPDAFKGKRMPQAFADAGLNAQEDNLANGIGQSYGVIGYKGKVWSLRYRGERHNILRPDDGTPSGYLDVIVLGQAKGKSKSYYPDGFEDGNSARPTCASIDGLVPDADVQAKQSETCALCPHNVFKTNPVNGRKGKECTDYKRLAVLILPTQTKPILGTPLLEPVFLRVPPASLTALAAMGEMMANQGHHYASYITRITFASDKAHPEMVFRALQGLTEDEAPLIVSMCKSPVVGRITGADIVLSGPKLVQQVLNPPGSSATGLAATTVSDVKAYTPAAKTIEIATEGSSMTVTGMTPTGLGDAGSGGLKGAPQTGAVTAPAMPDAGEPEESDAELDRQIALAIGGQAASS
jgi:hypothetical protein